jgi:prepilin-type N-terminal cleavage/methylation domain-containing protein
MGLPHRRSGFSLVEMIGVLAIIAILAVIIVPKVFSTIASSRVTSTAASVGALKTAVTDFYGKYNTIPLTTGNAKARLDDLLVAAGMLDSRFTPKIGTQPTTATAVAATWTQGTSGWTADTSGTDQSTQSRVISQLSSTTSPSSAAGSNFMLTGAGDLPASSRVVSAVVMQCTGTEARELSLRVDGEALSAAEGTADAAGKVVFAAPDATTGLTNVYIYITHQ